MAGSRCVRVMSPSTASRTGLVASVSGPSGSIRRTVSSSALVSTKFSRALASATALSQAVAGSTGKGPEALTPVRKGWQPMEVGHGCSLARRRVRVSLLARISHKSQVHRGSE